MSRPGPSVRVLGIDAALRATGYGCIESAGSGWRCLEAGVIRNPPELARSQSLRRIQEQIAELLARHAPEAVALEGGFYFKNARTALILGEVRGVIIAACAARGIPVYEYAPRRVKQSLLGTGAAAKDQVIRMVTGLFRLEQPPPEDAADALALALCHANRRTIIAELQPRPL